MNILEKKQARQHDPTIIKLMKKLQLFNHNIILLGSANIQSQKYFSDYDFFCQIDKKYKSKKLYDEIIKMINGLNDPNIYFIEFKIQFTDADKKLKWFSLDDFNYEQFNKNYNDIDYLKLDVIARFDYKFYEVSCIYKLDNTKLNNDELIQMLKDDIKTYIREGKYFKVLKRLFSMYAITEDYEKLLPISEILNSEFGKKYQLSNNLQTMLKVLDKTDDEDTIKKVIINLKDLKLEPNLDKIQKNINIFNRQINNYAEKLYKKFI